MAYFREQLKPGMTKKTSTPKRNARPSFKIVDEEGNPAPDVVREKARKNRIAYPIKDTYGKSDDPCRPENVELRMIKLLSELMAADKIIHKKEIFAIQIIAEEWGQLVTEDE